MYRILSLALASFLLSASLAEAGVASSGAKAVVRTFGREAVESAVKKTAKLVATEATERATKEAAEAAARRTASTVARRFGHVAASNPGFTDEIVQATAKLSSRNERRLMMLAPALQESGQAATVVTRLASGNADEFVETLWKHKDKLASAAVVTGLLVHGDDVVKTTGEVVIAGGEYIAKPVIDGTMDHVVAPASGLLVSGILLILVIGLVASAAFLFGGEATDRVVSKLREIARLCGRQW